MNIKQLSVKNFKCFENSNLEFSKLNIFLGSNSSGKSSMLNAILSVSQSSDHFPFKLSPNGKYVIMGDYHEFVRNHDSTQLMEIGLVLQEDNKNIDFRTIWQNDESTSMPALNSLEASSDDIKLSGIIYLTRI